MFGVFRRCAVGAGSIVLGLALASVVAAQGSNPGVQSAGEMTAPSWTLASDKAGDYTVDTKGRPYPVAQRTIHVDGCPAPPPPPEPTHVVDYFVGTGLSLWDLTRGNTFAPAFLVHFGVPLSSSSGNQTSFMIEGRLFFGHLGDVANNYQIWAGVRVRPW